MFEGTRLQQVALFSCLLFCCAACSTSSGNRYGGPPDGADSGSDMGDTTQYTIAISDFKYSPTSLMVPPGKVVTVSNQDLEAHTATSEAAMDDFSPGAVAGRAAA